MEPIVYINRKTGEKQIENVPGGSMMQYLYTRPFGKLSVNTLFKRKYVSAFGGRLMNWSYSKRKIDPFIQEHQIDINEFHVPEGGFKHFNDFFYRKIKPQDRPIEKGVVSPADGKILVFPNVNHSKEFYVKGQVFNLSTFLNNAELAKKYEGGSLMVIRLAPPDYHRYHFPTDGIPGENIKIKGDYFSVSPIALQKSIQIFLANKREYCVVDSPKNGKYIYCDVGATMTGGIIQTYTPGQPVKKGDEKGYFAFGGSTLILIFEPNAIEFDTDLIENTKNGFETYVKMGERIGE